MFKRNLLLLCFKCLLVCLIAQNPLLPRKHNLALSKRITKLPITQTNNHNIETKSSNVTKPEIKAESTTDTIYHRYKNGKLSMLETPLLAGHKKYFLYNLNGQVTYVFEDVRLSYIISTTFQFGSDGSISSAHIYTNPGASMYMYATDIQFKEDNIPAWKTEETIPHERLELDNKSYWNGHAWIPQQSVQEQQTPTIK